MINPWEFHGASLKLGGTTGYIDVTLDAPLLNKISTFAKSVDGKYKQLDMVPIYDYSLSFVPGKSQTVFLENVQHLAVDYTLPENILAVNKDIELEKLDFGVPMCDEGVRIPSIPGKACFSTDDMISFKSELIVDEKFRDVLTAEAVKGKIISEF